MVGSGGRDVTPKGQYQLRDLHHKVKFEKPRKLTRFGREIVSLNSDAKCSVEGVKAT